MLIKSGRELIYSADDTSVIEHRKGDTVASDFTDKSKYLVITHATAITSRDISDIQLVNEAGDTLTVGARNSGSDLEITRISDFQTVIKCNKAGVGRILARDRNKQLQAFYSDLGDIVLKWTFDEPDDVSYDIVKTVDGVRSVVASGITPASTNYVDGTSSAGGVLSSYYALTLPGELGNPGGVSGFSVVTTKPGNVTVEKALISDPIRFIPGESIVPVSSGVPAYVPPSPVVIPGVTPASIMNEILTRTVTINGIESTILDTESSNITLGPGALPKYSNFNLKKAYNIRYYSIRCDDPNLAITSWSLQGWNGSWVDLDVRSNETPWPTTKLYFIHNNGMHWAYRLKVTGVSSPAPDYLCVISEIKFFATIDGEGIGGMVIGDTFIID